MRAERGRGLPQATPDQLTAIASPIAPPVDLKVNLMVPLGGLCDGLGPPRLRRPRGDRSVALRRSVTRDPYTTGISQEIKRYRSQGGSWERSQGWGPQGGGAPQEWSPWEGFARNGVLGALPGMGSLETCPQGSLPLSHGVSVTRRAQREVRIRVMSSAKSAIVSCPARSPQSCHVQRESRSPVPSPHFSLLREAQSPGYFLQQNIKAQSHSRPALLKTLREVRGRP